MNFGKRLSIACVLIAALFGSSGCMYSAYQGKPPSSRAGYIPSPPRYVRVLEWVRPNMFRAEYIQSKRWFDEEYFLIISREPSSHPLGVGWYAPDWTKLNPSPELNEFEKAQLRIMQQRYPVGSEIELDYPLVEDKSDIGRDFEHDVSLAKIATSVSWHGAYTIVIKKPADAGSVPDRE